MTEQKVDYRRRYRQQPVAELIAPLADVALRKRGFTQGRLMQDWGAIVGGTLGNLSVPERIRFPKGQHTGGTLVVRVAYGWGVEFQHLAPVILEKIAQYFGYRAVEKLAVAQDPALKPPGAAKPAEEKALPPGARARLEEMLGHVTDERLRQNLARLGRAVMAGD